MALKIVYGLTLMRLVPTEPYEYTDPGETKTVARELATATYIQKTIERQVKFEWLDKERQAKCGLFGKFSLTIFLNKTIAHKVDEASWKRMENESDNGWRVQAVKIKITDKYGREGEIKFEGETATEAILRANYRHGSLMPY